MCIIKAYDLSFLPLFFSFLPLENGGASLESVSHIQPKESLFVNNSKEKIITRETSAWLNPWLLFSISPYCMLKEVNRKKILIILLFTDYRISFYCIYFKGHSKTHPRPWSFFFLTATWAPSLFLCSEQWPLGSPQALSTPCSSTAPVILGIHSYWGIFTGVSDKASGNKE